MTTINVNYFNEVPKPLPSSISDEEKRAIVNSTDYLVRAAVNAYKRALRNWGSKDHAVSCAFDNLWDECEAVKDERIERFLQVMAALELCGMRLL